MLRSLRIGARIGSADPFWVQVRESLYHHGQQLDLNLVQIDIGRITEVTLDNKPILFEELTSLNLDALICSYLPDFMLEALLQAGLPIIQLTETNLRHPLLVSASGFYEMGQMIGEFVVERLGGVGEVMVVGGFLSSGGEDGRTRLEGFRSVIEQYPQMICSHVPSFWHYEQAFPLIKVALYDQTKRWDAIFGLSDALALAVRDALRAQGRDLPLIVGVNGDPLALAAIVDGSLAATIDIAAWNFGAQALNLAVLAAMREPLPEYIYHTPFLVNADNVSQTAMQKLIEIASPPDSVVGEAPQAMHDDLAQLSTDATKFVEQGSLLDRQQVILAVAELLRTNYAYDQVRLWIWQEQSQIFYDIQMPERLFTPDDLPLLEYTLMRNDVMFVPDRQHSKRFEADVFSQGVRSQVVVPVRFGDRVLGLLDMQSERVLQHNREALASLQVLVDQLGVLMRNAELI